MNNGKSSLLEYKKFLKKHDQPFDESSIIKIKQNIALSKKFFNEVLNEKNNYENKNFFGKIVEIIIYRLFKIYKLTQKTYFGKKVIKFIALRIYHSLPTKIKRKLSIIIKN